MNLCVSPPWSLWVLSDPRKKIGGPACKVAKKWAAQDLRNLGQLNSICKCTTSGLVEDFLGRPVAEAFPWSVVQSIDSLLQHPG